jgi:phosphoglycolate phosphatase-like HAD superfamily hydrolase
MKNITDYKVILWDFDGVIMNSMPIRGMGFQEVLKDYPKEQVEMLLAFHEQNGGLSRYVKFRYFFEKIRGEKISNQQVLNYTDEFSKIMLSLLIDQNLLIEDSLDFIKKKHLNYDMHIVSGSDGNELRCICEHLGLSKYFISICGSPTPKNELVKQVIINNYYKKEETCLVGDSFNDMEAADVNQIEFFGYNNLNLVSVDNKYIVSFEGIGSE